MHRRKFLQLAAATTATAPLAAACSASSSGSSGGSGPVQLSVSVWSMATTPEFKALFDAFEKANPNITIKPVDILAADYSTKVKVMLSGGDSTDIITMKNTTDYGQFASRGQLHDISSLAVTSTAASLQGLSAFKQNGGAYYALPYRQDFWVLFYNKKIFDAAGKPYPTNLTWDQYAQLAQSLTSGSGSSKVYGTYHHTWRSVVQAISAAQTGGNLIGGHYEFLTNQYNTALAIQAAGATLDFGTASTQQTSYQSMLETGKAAMLPMGTWLAGTLLAGKAAGKTDIDWSIAPMPQVAGAGGVTTFGSPTAFAINKRSRNVDAAEKFISFATGPQGAQIVAGIGIVPALLNDDTRKTYFGLTGMPTDAGFKKAFAPDKVNLEMPVSPQSSQIDTILTQEHSIVMTKQKPVSAGIAEMDSRVQNEVE